MSPRQTLFSRLRSDAAVDWEAFVGHGFVHRLGDGSLPEDCFRHYLGQDYLFLIQFARAYGLAVYKSETLEDMRQAAAGMAGILDEMGLHVKYCHDWGITKAEMAGLAEARATLAYTRFVLDRGVAGDLLDLHVALAPCIIGYAEIGARLRKAAGSGLAGNPYRQWIDAYAGADYQALAGAQVAQIDRLMAARGGPGRYEGLLRVFRQAVRLETDFWEMGLTLAQ
ncbi:TenA family protein [Telmatospirillum siberiense]|uniref:Thiaminase II n=1 Tax=Telmatospirillum siberiense TaxID=382514 RepID=A0A2N3PXJ2_9PROT|nr:TenA family protein [Telmatospirillum siberiense]PKU25108.1 thiaminase II [Telmatospirillum siberiense]